MATNATSRPLPQHSQALAPATPTHRTIPSAHRQIAAAAGLLLAFGQAAAESAAPAAAAPTGSGPALQRVEIIGTAPVPGTGIDRNRIAAPVQHLGGARLDEVNARNLPELMQGQLGGVHVIDTQGNPYQMEVNFRGFTASPLLGQPQGLSVFLDGVRINEAFGDVVNWDLVPRNALASLTLMPGSNPLFGLNTLGGALVLATKSGDSHPGTEAELSLGSFGRKDLELSHGMKVGEQTYLFVATDLFKEDGWREHSPSQVRQLFAKLNQDDGPLRWSLSLQGADNSLVGNGLLPESMLAQNRRQIYTRPDRTDNQLAGLNFQGSHALGDGQQIQAQLHARRIETKTVNGDLNDAWDGISTETGVENRTRGSQRSLGLALQWSGTRADRHWVLGVSHDRNRTDFAQTEAEGVLDASRAVTDLEEEVENAVIQGRSRTSSLYALQTINLGPSVALTASGRYNDTRVTTVDIGRTRGLGTNLDADHTFRQFNPGIGATWLATPGLTVYGGLSQGNRAPSPIELGCSDPAQPCVLPNALQADPPLRQVVSQTVEAGVRGRLDSGWRWNAGIFSTRNRDDILFISNNLAAGYFANVGQTRRRGLELGLTGRTGAFDLGMNFTWLDATYRSSSCMVAESNSSAETGAACSGDDEIEVRSGDRLPGVPRQLFKLNLGWRALAGLRLGANLTAQSDAFVRGNDNGRHQPDGADFSGSGRVGGFAVLNLDAQWKLGGGWTLIGKVHNVFDRAYTSGGQLGRNAFGTDGSLLGPTAWRNEQFVAPGTPRAWTLALDWRFKD